MPGQLHSTGKATRLSTRLVNHGVLDDWFSTFTSDLLARSNRQTKWRPDRRSGSLLHAAADRILDQFREHSEP